jgi:predicted metal-dependent phosphotriesterase family hydrolase|tara:strand:- start:981 stop:1115 length:135 start_codon:yes stop_codon:yes gene_type:complete
MNDGFGYNFISSRLYSYLNEIGLNKEQFHQIMVENPRNALTGVS